MMRTLLAAASVLALAACGDAAEDTAADTTMGMDEVADMDTAPDATEGGAEPAPMDTAATPAATETAAPPATGPGPLPGWTTIGDGTWTMDGDEVVGVGAAEGMSFITTEETYDDFHLTLEFMITNPGNSGVFFRCADMAAIADTSCYEVNVFDDRPDQSGRTGGIPNIAAPMVEIDGQDGEWHSYDITVQGDSITVMLDGQTTIDIEDATHTNPSPIAIQIGTGENVVRLRNIEIAPL